MELLHLSRCMCVWICHLLWFSSGIKYQAFNLSNSRSTTDLRLCVNWSRIEAWAVWNCYRNAYMGWFSLSVLSSWCGGVMSNTHLCIIDISQHISLPVIVNRERCLQASIQDRWHITGHFTSGIKTDKNDIINHSKKQKHLRQLQLMHILE